MLLARFTEYAQHLSIQRQLVHAAWIGVGRIEHLIGRGRNTNRPRSARHECQYLLIGFQIGFVANCRTRVLVEWHIDRDRTQELSVAVEHLNPTVAAVRYVKITLRIGRNIMRIVELARLIATITPRLDPVAIFVGLCDARIDIAVADEDVPLRAKGYVRWLPEQSIHGGQWRYRMF